MASCCRSCANVAPIAASTALGNCVLPLLVIAAAFVTGSHALLLAALFIETVLLVNSVGHSLTALPLGSSVPGLITAIVINLPVGFMSSNVHYASNGFVLSRPGN